MRFHPQTSTFEKEASAKTKVIIGKCTRVSDGDTIHVVTDGNVKLKVRLDRIDAPEKDLREIMLESPVPSASP